MLPRTEKQDVYYKYDDKDGRGPWRSDNVLVKTFSKSGVFAIVNPNTKKEYWPPKGSCYRFNKATADRYLKENRFYFGKDGKGAPQLKRFLNEVKQGVTALTIWFRDEVGDNQEAKNEVRTLLNDGEFPFDTPKPVRLLKRVFQLATDKESIILDSFAGSGTTGHAILDLNKEDGGNRKFIMVEMEDAVAKDITAERVKRAIKKYDYKDGFEYCELDKPLFNEHGQIEETCEFKQFATYIYFTETQTNIDPKMIGANFIGELHDVEYYLIYKGKDKNDLDKSFIKKLKATRNKKVVYADRCLLDENELAKHNIVFKQIPYEVKIY